MHSLAPKPRIASVPSIPAFFYALCAVCALCAVFARADETQSQRPRDPWLFEGTLEGRPVVFLALHRKLTTAYDRQGCSLWLGWNGPAQAEPGPAPAGAGPEYRAAGPVYHRRGNASPWSVRGPKGIVPVTVRLAAAAVRDGQAELDYVVSLPGGKAIKVREIPEFDDHYGDNGLFRNFEVTGIPAGMALRLEVGGKGMPETWGGGAVGRLEKEGDRWFLIQELDGATPIKVTWSASGNSGK